MIKNIPFKYMPLELPLRKVGNSLMITIPADIAKLYGLKAGNTFEVIPEKDAFVLKSIKKDN